MPDWFFWLLITAIGVGAVAAVAYMWGWNRNQRAIWEVRQRADIERLSADANKRTTDIFSKPTGSKSDIIKRL